MSQLIPTKEMSQTKWSETTFVQDHIPNSKVSYGKRDGHIKEAEEKLMNKYRMGYSQLHKHLVLKEYSNQFSAPYL
jgi:hypothetical protein